MLDADRGRTRRERTFVGSECAVCEEPLEHTLAGERALQLTCGHVSHGACFYEYIREVDAQYCPTCNAPLSLDTSRGGNVIDVGKLSTIARPASRNGNTPTPLPWDAQSRRPSSVDASATNGHWTSHARDNHVVVDHSIRERSISRDNYRYAAPSRTLHARSNSDATGGPASSNGYSETAASALQRRHEYDLLSPETSHSGHRISSARNPIPSPQVSIRSEYPTINRSRQQQTLTCLVTIEVPDNKWTPDPEDLRAASPIPPVQLEETYARPPSPAISAPKSSPYESPEVLDDITENLRTRVENWHGLDFSRFGKLRLYGTLKVGKDRQAWQELECFLFDEMLICVKEKKTSAAQQWDDQGPVRKSTKCTLKGSILIKKHLNGVSQSAAGRDDLGLTQKITASNLMPPEDTVLTLSLSVAELPQFHLQFDTPGQLKIWQRGLMDLNAVDASLRPSEADRLYDTGDDDWQRAAHSRKAPSINSSYGGARTSATTAPTEYTTLEKTFALPQAVHIPLDIVVVVPISPSMQGVKITLVRDALRFLIANLGDRDRVGLVTFGSGGGGVPVVGMTGRTWTGWPTILASLKPLSQKGHPRADVIEGANVAMDLLMQRKTQNPLATILLISDSSTTEPETVDFVVSRAEAAKITIHSFGLGMTHKPDTMIELSTRTKASYTYVKDWMMLRECLAGCLGSLQTTSHQNVKLKLRLPEGSPAKFVKISGALQITKRATGRDAEAALGDLRFGDKRDVLVQLVITPDTTSTEVLPQDPWESIVSGLEALGGPDVEEQRTMSVEEVPLIQADLTWGDVLRDGTLSHLPRPSLLAITMLPSTQSQPNKKAGWSPSPPIPPHPSVVQRRMELLTSDMLTRALTLVSRNQHDRAQHLLNETRSILKGLGKGGLPPIPPNVTPKPQCPSPITPNSSTEVCSPTMLQAGDIRTPSPTSPISTATVKSRNNDTLSVHAPAVDNATVAALDAELEASLEWINHPAVFGRDSRKAVLQAIGVISSQRGYTFRNPIEELWAGRIGGVKKLMTKSREWREEGGGEGEITEEC